jgi:serine/threonine-protein kinase
MEYIEGESLADRLKKGALPLDHALRCAIEIADALDKAHRRGVVHRDLKPGNIMLTKAGAKLLDFGLAKLKASEPGQEASVLSALPTEDRPLTEKGSILGTFQYMAPEQLEGKEADGRTDIFAFGALLYEMVTGRKAFEGKSQASLISAIMSSQPRLLSEIQPMSPPLLDRIVQRCLAKDPEERWQSASDLMKDLKWIVDGAELDDAASFQKRPKRSRAIPWAVAVLTAVVAGALAVWDWRPILPIPPVKLEVKLTEDDLFVRVGSGVALSPDGTRVAYVVGDPVDGSSELRIRPFGQLDGTTLASGGAYHPFFSPDSQWVGFVTVTELQKVNVAGRSPLPVAGVNMSRGASWGPDNTIVFSPAVTSGLLRVSADGGGPKPLTELDRKRGELSHRWPQVLPGGKAVLFTSQSRNLDYNNATIEVLELQTGERKVIHRGGSYARYVPTGHIVYAHRGELFAAAFDVDRLDVIGAALPIVQGVTMNPLEGGAQFSFAETGALAYVAGTETLSPKYPVVWVDRQGTTAPLWSEPGQYGTPVLSPDGRRLAVSLLSDGNIDVWVYDMEREVATRLTSADALDRTPVWAPDGRHLVFDSDRDGTLGIYRMRADGAGEPERLMESELVQYPCSWSSDGSLLVYGEHNPETGWDIGVLALGGEVEPQVVLDTPANEIWPDISPDGRWIAYSSDESGRHEVYVRPYPLEARRWQVSDNGGGQPHWSQDGRELFYRTGSGIMAVPVNVHEGAFDAGKPVSLFEQDFRGSFSGVPLGGYTFQKDYDVSPDGKRFVMFAGRAFDPSGARHMILVLDWFEELKRLVPTPRP